MLEQIHPLAVTISISAMLHATASSVTLKANRKSQSGLWPFGISGDYPILLLCMNDESEAELLQIVLPRWFYLLASPWFEY